MADGDLTLVLGDKAISSWSLRAWLVLKQFSIPFREERVRLRRPETREQILKHGAGATVPILQDGPVRVWETIAIAEYLAERFPHKAMWPQGAAARAYARSTVAEMHAGFAELRSVCPMALFARMEGFQLGLGVKRDVERIEALWHNARSRHGGDGPFLFGAFTIADAFYAPVCTRFRTYGITVSAAAAAYCEAIFGLPAMREWEAAAKAEAAETM